MLAVMRFRCRLRGAQKRSEREGFAIEPMRKTMRHVIRGILRAFRLPQRKYLAANHGIDQRTIGRNPHHDIRADSVCRLQIAGEYVLF